MAISNRKKLQIALNSLSTFLNSNEIVFAGNLDIKLSPTELKVLTFVGRRKSVMMREISTTLTIYKNNLTSVVNKLEDKNLIQRNKSAKDKRIFKVVLTNKGQLLFNECTKQQTEAINNIFKNLTSSERTQLVHVLEKIDLPE